MFASARSKDRWLLALGMHRMDANAPPNTCLGLIARHGASLCPVVPADQGEVTQPTDQRVAASNRPRQHELLLDQAGPGQVQHEHEQEVGSWQSHFGTPQQNG